MTATTLNSGVIRADAAYSLAEFKARTGMGRDAMTEARKRGLTVRRSGTRSYILGQDWLAYLESSRIVDSDGKASD